MRIGKKLKVKGERLVYCAKVNGFNFAVPNLDSCFLALNSSAQ